MKTFKALALSTCLLSSITIMPLSARAEDQGIRNCVVDINEDYNESPCQVNLYRKPIYEGYEEEWDIILGGNTFEFLRKGGQWYLSKSGLNKAIKVKFYKSTTNYNCFEINPSDNVCFSPTRL